MKAKRIAELITYVTFGLAVVGGFVMTAKADTAGGAALGMAFAAPFVIWVLINGLAAFVQGVSNTASDIVADGVRKSRED